MHHWAASCFHRGHRGGDLAIPGSERGLRLRSENAGALSPRSLRSCASGGSPGPELGTQTRWSSARTPMCSARGSVTTTSHSTPHPRSSASRTQCVSPSNPVVAQTASGMNEPRTVSRSLSHRTTARRPSSKHNERPDTEVTHVANRRPQCLRWHLLRTALHSVHNVSSNQAAWHLSWTYRLLPIG